MNKPKNFSDFFALSMTKFFRFVADTFFAKRYGHRAVVLETIAGVPGMVAGMLIHLRSLRKMKTGYGSQIREMLAEAENERMHLMFFIEIAKPNAFERFLVIAAQAIFMAFYLFMYIFFPKTSHRMIGYFEDEAVKSYTEYLKLVEDGKVMNIRAPKLAIEYYNLKKDARLSDLIISVRADEMHHAEVNHDYANNLQRKAPKETINQDLDKEVA
tara:strand:+ start:164 stop:805 length:642 start_codon:yes stop_codon:yes gene_type:complete